MARPFALGSLIALSWLAPRLAHAQSVYTHWANRGSPPGTMDFGVGPGLLFAMTVTGLVLALLISGRRGPAPRPGPQARAWMNVDVSVLRIVFDARSREFLTRELSGIPMHAAAQSRSISGSLGRIVRLLRKCDAGWVYGGSSNYHPMSPPIAETTFDRHAGEARAKLEALRDREATSLPSTIEDPGYRDAAPSDEHLALLTLVVAGRREIRDFYGGRRTEIHAVLNDLERLAQRDLVAFDLSWTPADASAPMTAATLHAITEVAKLPEPHPRHGVPGRTSCVYCKGPFATKLPTCPHCGAPARLDPPVAAREAS